jgi:hypothetical protein
VRPTLRWEEDILLEKKCIQVHVDSSWISEHLPGGRNQFLDSSPQWAGEFCKRTFLSDAGRIEH